MNDRMDNTDNRLSDPGQWVETHGDYLFGYAFKRLRNRGVAEDVVQETFLAALSARQDFAGQSAERTWLTGILKNKIIDHFRKSSREVEIDQDELDNYDSDDNFFQGGLKSGNWKVGRRPADWHVDTADRAELSEFWKFLYSCLEGIDSRMAVVFVLREMEEMKSEEICNNMGLSSTNLRVMLYRARKLLRKCLENNWINSGKLT